MSHYTFIINSTVLFLFALSGGVARADNTTIFNAISVSSNTGGNTTSGGSVTEGYAESRVDSTTIVNGVLVDEVHERSTGTPITRNRTVRATGTTVTTAIELNTLVDTAPIPPAAAVSRDTDTPTTPVTNKYRRSTPATPTTAIINTNNQSVDEDTSPEIPEAHPSLMAQILLSIRRAFTYVLSNIFS